MDIVKLCIENFSPKAQFRKINSNSMSIDEGDTPISSHIYCDMTLNKLSFGLNYKKDNTIGYCSVQLPINYQTLNINYTDDLLTVLFKLKQFLKCRAFI